ncbi:MAG TPA: hypothetical protein VII75_08645 [Thermoanaerobaculia bacterium]|nr:hypothetical protein [Thermoanaerobaculia bacterium]
MAEVIPFVVQETPTVTEMDKIAERVRAAVDAVAELIPRLERPHPSTRKGVRAHRTVPRDFIAAMIAAVEQVEQLQVVDKFDTGDARETLQFLDAFRPVADQLAALTAALRFTMESRKARVVDAGLQTYDIARALARGEVNTPLTGHLPVLKRNLRRAKTGR